MEDASADFSSGAVHLDLAEGAMLALSQDRLYHSGHDEDHRPDLRQLPYILTLSEDGGVPVHFRAASGNVVDDQTHRHTWQTLSRLAGRPDFLYVADCKLATTENMT